MIEPREAQLVCAQVAQHIGTLHNLAIHVDEDKTRIAWARAYRAAGRARCELRRDRERLALSAMEICLEQARVLLTLANQSGRHPEACAPIDRLINVFATALRECRPAVSA